MIRTFSIKLFSPTPDSKDRMRAKNLWLPGHGHGDAAQRARSMANKITDLDKLVRRLIAIYEEAKANHPEDLKLVTLPFLHKTRKMGVRSQVPDYIVEEVFYDKVASKPLRTFSIKEPEYYKIRFDNSRIDIEIAQLKSEIAAHKVRLSQLNEAKSKSNDKDLFIDQMDAVRDQINKLQGDIEKLKSKYKVYENL